MLPAFGRELLELRRGGKRPAQPVYVVGNWDLARALRARDRFALMVEGERDQYGFSRFARFDFSMLQDLDVVLIPDSLEWIGVIGPQVASSRPRTLERTLVFYPGFSVSAGEEAEIAIARFEAERQAA